MSFDAILFDFDGVLLDSEPVHFECWASVLAPLGAVLDWDTYSRHCIGIADRDMIEMLARRADPPVPFERLWAQYPLKKERFRARMKQGAPFPPGIAEFLCSLRPRYQLAVVTSSARSEVEPLLKQGGLHAHLSAIVCREDVPRLKPAPDPYLEAARLLGAGSALVLEDSDAGMESARAAGLEALRVPSAAETISLLQSRLGLHR